MLPMAFAYGFENVSGKLELCRGRGQCGELPEGCLGLIAICQHDKYRWRAWQKAALLNGLHTASASRDLLQHATTRTTATTTSS